MAHGRKTGGRQKGTPNKATAAKAAAVAASGQTPLDFMLDCMRNGELPFDARLDAAKSAAPYIHPRLQSVTVAGDKDRPLQLISRIELVPLEPQKKDDGAAD